MAERKTVRATEAGYAPKYPGAPVQRIKVGTVFEVLPHQKGSWFVDVSPSTEPAKSPSPRRKKPEDPATESAPLSDPE